MSSVRIQKLCIRFDDNEVIKDLDLDVIESEFLVLLGPSGCGKSTLLHSIAGLIDVADGRIEIGGKDMTWADPTDRNIGMVFQSYALYPTMSVERNMSFGLRINGTPKPEIERRVARAAEMLQLQPLLNRKPAQLSGGQRQRVAIGRALVREAGVFLFDEPLSNLDAKLRAELRRELKILHKNLRSTMIYVTHDQVEAMTLASRIVVMRAGKIQQIGAPAAVYEKPDNLFVAGFIGSPAINLLKGSLRVQAEKVQFVCADLSLELDRYAFKGMPVDQQEVVVGIRPENLCIGADGEFQATVSLIEPMVNHQRVKFSIDVEKISVFDQHSEQRL